MNVLIISLHAGEEYSPEPTPFQISFAHSAIDAGADLVVGHHPHMLQKIEKYRAGWIAQKIKISKLFQPYLSSDEICSLLIE